MSKFTEMLDSLTARVNNPLLFSFILSWLVANYKIILVFVDNESYRKKIEYIENVLYANISNPINRLFWIPLAASVFYVALLPLISLATTALTALYENWHQSIKTQIAGKFRLSLEDSNTLKKEVADRLDKIERENQELSVARIDISRKASEKLTSAIATTLPYIFIKLKEDAKNWPESTVRKMVERGDSGGSQEQHDFLREYGLPENWLQIFKQWTDSGNTDVRRAAITLGLSEAETLDVLMKLCAVGMISATWLDDDLFFNITDAPWQRFLNGRPA